MPKEYIIVPVLAGVLFFLVACQKPEPATAPPPRLPKRQPAEIDGTLACYLNSCFETTPVNHIQDPQGDYTYTDPENFPDEDLRKQYTKPFHILDLHIIDPRTPVAENFVLVDFMSESKGRYGLYSSDVIMKLQLIRNAVKKPLYINSGYRSPAYNRSTDGSASWSRHMYGDAADFHIQNVKIEDLTALCDKYGASFTLTYPNHIHCDWRKSSLDPAFYSPTKTSAEKEIWINVAELMGQQSRIHHAINSESLFFSTQIPHLDEEEGAPTHNWQIILPTNKILTSANKILVAPKIHGTYKIKVVVGGSIVIEDNFTW